MVMSPLYKYNIYGQKKKKKTFSPKICLQYSAQFQIYIGANCQRLCFDSQTDISTSADSVCPASRMWQTNSPTCHEKLSIFGLSTTASPKWGPHPVPSLKAIPFHHDDCDYFS